ncbi:unnamed protein product [Caenorhabditis nigoni]
MDEIFRLATATIMGSFSSIGIVVNVYVLYALATKKGLLSIFYKLCISKTICNLITCAAFLMWSAPCTLLSFYYLPYWANVLWGQLAGWGAYITGICIQVCLSLNRFTVTYFPFSSNRNNKILNIRNCLMCLTSVFILSSIYGFPEGCGYIYSIELASWMPENSECATRHADQLFNFIISVAIVSNSANLATFIKLMKIKNSSVVSISKNADLGKKRKLMFAQSVTQDCLHMIDMLACQVIYKFNDALWFQFICMSVVWLTIHVFDGFVMMIYNRDIHLSFMKRILKIERAATIVSSSKII